MPHKDKTANGATPKPPKKRKRKPATKKETQIALGTKPKPPKKRRKRG